MGARASREDGRPNAQELAERPVWKGDESAFACGACGGKFGAMPGLGRHHCRGCGDVFCGSCSSHRREMPLAGYKKPQRLCTSCFSHASEGDWEEAVLVKKQPVPQPPAEPVSVQRARSVDRSTSRPLTPVPRPLTPAQSGLGQTATPSTVHLALDADARILFSPLPAAPEYDGAPTDEILAMPFDDALVRWPYFGAMMAAEGVTPEKRGRVRTAWGTGASRWLRQEIEQARKLGAFAEQEISPSTQGVTDSGVVSDATPSPRAPGPALLSLTN